jgi:hypothetical protein
VGRPLAALLANDGAHVYSVDIADVQEFTRGVGLRKRRHEANEKAGWTLENCLPLSDVVISGVPGDKYKVPLEKMKDGAVCINFSSDRNFTPEVKEKASIYVPAIGKVTIAVLLRNLLVSIRMLPLWMMADSDAATCAKQNRCGRSGCGRDIIGRASHSIDSINRCLPSFILRLLILIPYRRQTRHKKSISVNLLTAHLFFILLSLLSLGVLQ